MGSTIILDPFDVWRLTTGLGISFEALLEDKLELNLVEGVILPNMKTSGEQERCGFLNAEGRCSIHGDVYKRQALRICSSTRWA